jgi:hypothetical protein
MRVGMIDAWTILGFSRGLELWDRDGDVGILRSVRVYDLTGRSCQYSSFSTVTMPDVCLIESDEDVRLEKKKGQEVIL